MTYNLGFTGSSEPPSREAIDWLHKYLVRVYAEHYVDECGGGVSLHHGDCIGADYVAHMLASQIGFTTYIHPPSNPKKRAWCLGSVIFPEKPYMDRNSDIVRASEALVALPSGPEMLRSGTWSTVRKARKNGVCRLTRGNLPVGGLDRRL